MKFTIIKVSADGEQISAEVHLDKDMLNLHRGQLNKGSVVRVHLREQLAPLFDLVDARLLEMNHRVMASNYLIQKLPPEAMIAVSNVMDVLHGKTPGPAVEAIVDQAKAEVAAQREKGEEARKADEEAEAAGREAERLLKEAEESGVVQGSDRKPRKPRNPKVPQVDGLPVEPQS